MSIYAASNSNKSLQDLPKLAKLQLSLENEMKMIAMERRLIDRLNGSIDSKQGLKKPHVMPQSIYWSQKFLFLLQELTMERWMT